MTEQGVSAIVLLEPEDPSVKASALPGSTVKTAPIFVHAKMERYATLLMDYANAFPVSLGVDVRTRAIKDSSVRIVVKFVAVGMMGIVTQLMDLVLVLRDIWGHIAT